MKNIFISVVIISLLSSCSGNEKKTSHENHQQGQPAITPTQHQNTDLALNDSQMKLANITTERVSLKPIGQTMVLNARLVVDEERTEIISSRAAGRVEKLFFKETGRLVKKGEPLFELYSETLLTLQREYLLAKEQFEVLGKSKKRYETFLKAAESKLLLYGVSKKQIEQIGKSKTAKQRITFLAPASGMITEIKAAEGQYIGEGAILYRVEDISRLWVEAEIYPQETDLVKIGDIIHVKVNGFESAVESKVIFLSPEYQTNSQITIMRALIENTDMVFKPGMEAQVLFTHSTKKALAIPTDAVIRNEQGAHVYVQAGNNIFQSRMVKTGLEDFEQVEITEGLKETDTVAVTGAYLLYSELILKKGVDPMATHYP